MSQDKTGGCQCGRIRYTVSLENGDAYLCHCRMCQRATGGFAATFAFQVPQAAIQWGREPDWYQSSPIAHRAFCSACGTPFGFAFLDSDAMDLTVGSFDDPAFFVPRLHTEAEGLHEAWLDTPHLPRQTSRETDSVTSHWKAAGLEMPE